MRNTERSTCNNPVIERIETTLKERNLSQLQLIDSLGLGASAFTRWKYDNGKSYLKYIDQIADFLGVSVDYLLHGNSPGGWELTAQEIKMIHLFRSISKKGQETILYLLKVMNVDTKISEKAL